jgi:hypothetical protein
LQNSVTPDERSPRRNTFRDALDPDTRRTIDRAYKAMHRLRFREAMTRHDFIAHFATPLALAGGTDICLAHPADRYDEAFQRIVKARRAIGVGDEDAARAEARAVRVILARDASSDASRLTGRSILQQNAFERRERVVEHRCIITVKHHPQFSVF